MNLSKEEALDIFKTIIALYPSFNTKGDEEYKRNVARIWVNKLMKADYRLTKNKLDNYSNSSSFPPSIADIIQYAYKETPIVTYSKELEDVRLEKADPKTSKVREEKLKKLRSALGGVLRD